MAQQDVRRRRSDRGGKARSLGGVAKSKATAPRIAFPARTPIAAAGAPQPSAPALAHRSTPNVAPVALPGLELLARLTLIGAFVYGLVQVWSVVGGALFPVVTALLLSYLLSPFVRRFQRRGLSQGAGIAIVMLVLVLIAVAFSVVLYPVLAREISGVVERAPVVLDSLQENLPRLMERLGSDYGIVLPTTLAGAISNYGAGLKSSVPGMLNSVGSWGFSALIKTGGVLSGVLNVVLIPVFMVFFLPGISRLEDFLSDLIPTHLRPAALTFFRKLDGVATSWFRGQIQVTFILSLLYGCGLALVFGLSGFGAMNGFAVGALTGVLNIIPYVGVATGFVLAMAMAMIEWNGLGPVIGIIAVFATVQISDGYFITPRVVGTKVGLSTVWVLIALLVGGALAGLLGMLFAVPVAALIRAAWPDAVRLYRESAFFKRE